MERSYLTELVTLRKEKFRELDKFFPKEISKIIEQYSRSRKESMDRICDCDKYCCVDDTRLFKNFVVSWIINLRKES